MLSNISWSSYFAAVSVLIVLYYGFVVLKYYRSHITNLLKRKDKKDLLEGSEDSGDHVEDPFGEFTESFDTLEETKELYNRLINVIIESNDRDLSKVEFTNYIRFILDEYPFVKQSALRDKINSLMALESAKWPKLGLTYSEMDALWQETTL